MHGLLPIMIMAELLVYSHMHHLDLFLVESDFTKHVSMFRIWFMLERGKGHIQICLKCDIVMIHNYLCIDISYCFVKDKFKLLNYSSA